MFVVARIISSFLLKLKTSNMFSQKNTLNKKDFQKTFQKGASYGSDIFVLKVLENKLNKTRVGVGVSSKVFKRATERNYYKRILKHILKESIPDLGVSYDVILVLQNNPQKNTFQELKKNANSLLQKSGFFE